LKALASFYEKQITTQELGMKMGQKFMNLRKKSQ